MKKLSLIGFVLSIIVLIFALYIQFVIVPDADVAEVAVAAAVVDAVATRVVLL